MTTISDLINDFTIEVVELSASKGYDLSEDSIFKMELNQLQDELLEDIKNILHRITS
jgi:hypothetical protein